MAKAGTLGAVACLAAVCALPVSGAKAQTVFNGHTYLLTSAATNWNAAEAEAVGVGGHLATVNNLAEQNFLVSTFLTGGFANLPLWIGLNDAAVEGTFVWASGEAVTFTAWKASEPNNFGGNEDWVTINWGFARGDAVPQGQWNDTPLNGTNGFGGNTNGPYFGIIEIPAAAVAPEPGAGFLVLFGLSALSSRLRRRR